MLIVSMRLPSWLPSHRLWLLGIIAIAAVLRLWQIGTLPPGLYPDEAAYANDAVATLEGSWQWLYPHNNGREGLFIWLQALALAVTGVHEPWVVRSVSAILGILTIPGMYYLSRALWSRRIGLISAALLTTSFWHITFSRIGFRAILVPLIVTWSLGLLIVGFRSISKDGTGAWQILLGGLLAGVGVHTYLSFRAAIITYIATTLVAWWAYNESTYRHKLYTYSVLGGIIAILVASPLLFYFYTHPAALSGRTAQVSVFSAPHPVLTIAKNTALLSGMLVIKGDSNWRHNFPGMPAVPTILIPGLVAGIYLLGRRLWEQRGKHVQGVVITSLVISAVLPAVLSNEGMPHALRSILLVIPVLLVTAYGVEYLARWLTRTPSYYIYLIVGIITVTGIHTVIMYHRYVQYPEVAAEFTKRYADIGYALREREIPQRAYVIVPRGDVLIEGIPVAAQTTMFISDTATKEKQQKQNVTYLIEGEEIPTDGDIYYLNP